MAQFIDAIISNTGKQGFLLTVFKVDLNVFFCSWRSLLIAIVQNLKAHDRGVCCKNPIIVVLYNQQ